MKRQGKIILACFFIIASVFVGVIWKQNKKRIIDVCILNDARAPVRDARLIKEVVHQVSLVYERYVRIKLAIREFHFYSGDLSYAWYHDSFPDLSPRAACAPRSEIVISITNRRRTGFMERDDVYYEFMGENHPNGRGIVTIYNFEALSHESDSDGAPLLVKVLNHEIGHAFSGSFHSNDLESFMYPGLASRGGWTAETVDSLMKYRNRRF